MRIRGEEKNFCFLLSFKHLYLSKRKIRQVGAELLMRMWADKKEETYLGAMSIPISLVRSKSTVDRVNIKIAYRPKTIR